MTEAEDMKKIIWLASYPKSGNTWFRAYLTYLLNPQENKMDINNLAGGPIASSREHFDDITGLSSSDLTHEEIETLRPDVYRYLAKNAREPIYKKVHDAYVYTKNGDPLIPAEVTRAVIYFIRNPLDIVASFANHLNKSLDDTIKVMANEYFAFCNKTNKLHNQLEQKLYTWSHHVTSWVDESGLPVLVVRYEDMIAETFKTFININKFLDLEYTQKEINAAIEASSFEKMQKQEKINGFKEKTPDSSIFFRQGTAGLWKKELSKNQVESIVSKHSEVMSRFGYITHE